MLPPVGAAVWVEFEGGDLDYAIWSGCFWREGERPVGGRLSTTRMIPTSSCKFILNDLPGEGGFTLSVMDPAVAVPITISRYSTGLSITLAQVSIDVSETGVKIWPTPPSCCSVSRV